MDKVARFFHAFVMEHIALMLYWMVVVYYTANRIDSLLIVFWGVIATTAILFVTKLSMDVLLYALEASSNGKRKSTKRIVWAVLLFVASGAAYSGWTIFSIKTDSYISGRTMSILCVITAVSIILLNLLVERALGYLPDVFDSIPLTLWRQHIEYDEDYDDGDG